MGYTYGVQNKREFIQNENVLVLNYSESFQSTIFVSNFLLTLFIELLKLSVSKLGKNVPCFCLDSHVHLKLLDLISRGESPSVHPATVKICINEPALVKIFKLELQCFNPLD